VCEAGLRGVDCDGDCEGGWQGRVGGAGGLHEDGSVEASVVRAPRVGRELRSKLQVLDPQRLVLQLRLGVAPQVETESKV